LSETSAAGSERTPRQERTCAEGQVWISYQDRLVPAGALLNLSEGGLSFRHNRQALGSDGFPLPVPAADQQILLALTLRTGERPRPLPARLLRVSVAKDGSVEVACQFESHDTEDLAKLHQHYVAASLQGAKKNLVELRARLFHEPQAGRTKPSKLGCVLVKRRSLSRGELSTFLEGNRTGVRLGQELVRAGLVSARELSQALSEHFGLPFVDLSVAVPSPAAWEVLPPDVACRLQVVPFALEGGKLLIAAARPLRFSEEKELERLCRRPVKLHLASPEQITGHLVPPLAARHPRSKPRISAGAVARYRFYGSALQLIDARIFEGAAANVSETGLLLGGPVPQVLLEAFQKPEPPQVLMAVQLFHGAPGGPSLLHFDPVRISRLVRTGEHAWTSGLPDAPLCWIGAHVSPRWPEDRRELARLFKSLRTYEH
jgi:hypothetical protein